uniref:Uncharacterized protein n=1 Tax=Arundo donax TaxID=35708 RepID=A0A0A9C7S3_ARUDO
MAVQTYGKFNSSCMRQMKTSSTIELIMGAVS